ncbi:MAG: hypothetical protein U1E67_13020 [Hyphomicrobiales bacterium]
MTERRAITDCGGLDRKAVTGTLNKPDRVSAVSNVSRAFPDFDFGELGNRKTAGRTKLFKCQAFRLSDLTDLETVIQATMDSAPLRIWQTDLVSIVFVTHLSMEHIDFPL